MSGAETALYHIYNFMSDADLAHTLVDVRDIYPDTKEQVDAILNAMFSKYESTSKQAREDAISLLIYT